MTTQTPTEKVIYFINRHGTNDYKIGITSNLDQRLKTLQTGSEKPLDVIALLQHNEGTDESKEKIIHDYLNPTINGKQKHLVGEWYTLSPGWLHTILFELTTKFDFRRIKNVHNTKPFEQSATTGSKTIFSNPSIEPLGKQI